VIYLLLFVEREPKGYIRVLGLGPTPQDVSTPGLKCYAPTRLQMENFARMKAESDKAALEQRRVTGPNGAKYTRQTK
jgi:hypothetical protein